MPAFIPTPPFDSTMRSYSFGSTKLSAFAIASFSSASIASIFFLSARKPFRRSASRRSLTCSIASSAFFSSGQFLVPMVSVPLKAELCSYSVNYGDWRKLFTEPTFTYVWNDTTGASCRSMIRKRRPFGSVNSVTFFSNS
ncbi:MAG: hypothetical protein DMG59_24760 [Acidobacteria bacterium]|nr:MAG: hypothetical protein DMG59_24760 [Acidobacteriota bacterium]